MAFPESVFLCSVFLLLIFNLSILHLSALLVTPPIYTPPHSHWCIKDDNQQITYTRAIKMFPEPHSTTRFPFPGRFAGSLSVVLRCLSSTPAVRDIHLTLLTLPTLLCTFRGLYFLSSSNSCLHLKEIKNFNGYKGDCVTAQHKQPDRTLTVAG